MTKKGMYGEEVYLHISMKYWRKSKIYRSGNRLSNIAAAECLTLDEG